MRENIPITDTNSTVKGSTQTIKETKFIAQRSRFKTIS